MTVYRTGVYGSEEFNPYEVDGVTLHDSIVEMSLHVDLERKDTERLEKLCDASFITPECVLEEAIKIGLREMEGKR